MIINPDRMAETFKTLVRIDSVSREEGAISKEIVKMVEAMGAETAMDSSGPFTGSETGNLVVRFKGNRSVSPILLSAHMDTVEPGRGVAPVLKDGIFRSNGTTILGGDDKTAIAIILEVVTTIQENRLPCGPIEVVLTTCEEIGLLGAKHLDFNLISATFGYVLDSADTEGIVNRAPAANKVRFTVHGKDAHAGANPERGINAISLAGRAIAGIESGRIDHETTCNIGTIEGGMASNIVPSLVTVTGEVRSHDPEKLDRITNDMVASFNSVIDESREIYGGDLPRLDIEIDNDFKNTNIPQNHPVIVLAKKAAENLGREMVAKTTGGGADANIFFEKGIVAGVLGTGMHDVHSVREYAVLDEMVKTAELIVEILKLHAKK